MGVLDRYLQNPYGNAQTTDGQLQPQIDSSNAIVSLAAMMGPTPAEREAAERRMQKNQAQMAAWTGLFDGLRQLGNLYYTAKGAVSQKYDNPYSQVQQNYQQQRQLYNDMATYRRNYATSLYNLRRQMADDARRNKLADAQADYYNSREETARQKAELDKLKAVRVIKMQDGSLMKFDPVSGNLEQLSESDPLYVQYMQERINNTKAQTAKTNKQSSLIGAAVTTTTNDGKGNVKTSVRSYGSNKKSDETAKRGSLLPKSGSGNTGNGRGRLLPK